MSEEKETTRVFSRFSPLGLYNIPGNHTVRGHATTYNIMLCIGLNASHGQRSAVANVQSFVTLYDVITIIIRY